MVTINLLVDAMFFKFTKLTLSVRAEYIYSAASQATSPAPFKYLFNKYLY
jgi:hypothetical protein